MAPLKTDEERAKVIKKFKGSEEFLGPPVHTVLQRV